MFSVISVSGGRNCESQFLKHGPLVTFQFTSDFRSSFYSFEQTVQIASGRKEGKLKERVFEAKNKVDSLPEEEQRRE